MAVSRLSEAPNYGRRCKFSVNLEPAQIARLDELAERKQTDRSSIVRQVLDLGLNQQAHLDRLVEAALAS